MQNFIEFCSTAVVNKTEQKFHFRLLFFVLPKTFVICCQRFGASHKGTKNIWETDGVKSPIPGPRTRQCACSTWSWAWCSRPPSTVRRSTVSRCVVLAHPSNNFRLLALLIVIRQSAKPVRQSTKPVHQSTSPKARSPTVRESDSSTRVRQSRSSTLVRHSRRLAVLTLWLPALVLAALLRHH